MISNGYCESDLELAYIDSIGDVLKEYQDLSLYGTSLYEAGLINSVQLEYFNQLNDLILNSIDFNEAYNAGIDELENNLYEDKSLSEDEKILLWGSILIAS